MCCLWKPGTGAFMDCSTTQWSVPLYELPLQPVAPMVQASALLPSGLGYVCRIASFSSELGDYSFNSQSALSLIGLCFLFIVYIFFMFVFMLFVLRFVRL